MIISDRMLM